MFTYSSLTFSSSSIHCELAIATLVLLSAEMRYWLRSLMAEFCSSREVSFVLRRSVIWLSVSPLAPLLSIVSTSARLSGDTITFLPGSCCAQTLSSSGKAKSLLDSLMALVREDVGQITGWGGSSGPSSLSQLTVDSSATGINSAIA